MPGRLIVVTGPSGSGKSTIVRKLVSEFPSSTQLATCTTRDPRPEEVQNHHYHFLSEEEFAASIAAGELFEYARVYGNWYGSRRADLEAALAVYDAVFMVLDLCGARQVVRQMPSCRSLFIAPERKEILASRIADRPGNDAAARLEAAERELASAAEFDLLLVNREGRLEETVAAAKAFVFGRDLSYK